jgi:hypothetical protein
VDKFEEAARKKLRFRTKIGDLMVEDLFDLPLTSTTGKPNLDAIAIALNEDLQKAGVKSFVSDKTLADETLQLAFDIVRHVIEVKKTENAAALQKKVVAEKKRRILELLAKKEDEALASKSEDELKTLLSELD